MSLYTFDEFVNNQLTNEGLGSIIGKVGKKLGKTTQKVAKEGKSVLKHTPTGSSSALASSHPTTAGLSKKILLFGWSVALIGTLTNISMQILNRKDMVARKLAAIEASKNKEVDDAMRESLLNELKRLNDKQSKVDAKIAAVNKKAKAEYDKSTPDEKRTMLERGKKAKDAFLKKFKR